MKLSDNALHGMAWHCICGDFVYFPYNQRFILTKLHVKVWRQSGQISKIGIGVRADNTPEYGDIRGQSEVEGCGERRVASAYKGLRPFRAVFAWILERDGENSEDESEVRVRELYTKWSRVAEYRLRLDT